MRILPRMGDLVSFRARARLEGVTLLLLLLVAIPLKYLGGQPELVRILGPLHGGAFLFFLHGLYVLVDSGQLPARDAWRVLGAALVPLGWLWSERRLRALDLSTD